MFPAATDYLQGIIDSIFINSLVVYLIVRPHQKVSLQLVVINFVFSLSVPPVGVDVVCQIVGGIITVCIGKNIGGYRQI